MDEGTNNQADHCRLSGEDFKGMHNEQWHESKIQNYCRDDPWDKSDGLVEKCGSQFQRRALKGQCQQPYFGCREFLPISSWLILRSGPDKN